MGYSSDLEARLARKVTRAIASFDLIEADDRVMVGLSGGKDSWALMQILDVLRRRSPVRFSLIAVNVDSGYDGYRHDAIAAACDQRGWEYRIEHTSIGEIMDDVLSADATPCSLCARLRRGVLYRPLVNVSGDEARAYTRACELPVIGCCCPVCGDLSLKRQRIKRLLIDLDREHPGLKQSMLKALGNVAPRHLLDTRLNPPAALRATAACLVNAHPPLAGAESH